MDKYVILNSMKTAGILSVIRGKNEKNTYQTAKACIDGGIKGIEIAFTSPNATNTIKKLTQEYFKDSTVIVGAGTILDEHNAVLAINSGAKFIVSPSFNKEVAKICNLYSTPYIPGCYTPSEIQKALMYGADVVKIFPAAMVGPKIINEIHGPFPLVDLMPSGGVNIDNLKEWFDAGSFCVGVGGSLVGPGKNDDYETVTNNAVKFKEELQKVKFI